jgi:hypothetical protein
MAKIEYLDDFDSFIQEIVDLGSEPEIRMQGRGRGVRKRPDAPPFVEAAVILTHWDSRTNVIREAVSFVGEVATAAKDEVEFLRICLNSEMEDLSSMLQEKGCVVKKGRWVT